MPSIAASHFFPRKIISEGGICAIGLCLSFPIYFCIRPPRMTKPVSFLLDKRSFHMQCLSCPRPSFAHQASACARSFVRVTSGRLALYTRNLVGVCLVSFENNCKSLNSIWMSGRIFGHIFGLSTLSYHELVI